MSVTTIGSSMSQSLGAEILQALTAGSSTSSQASSTSSPLSDLLSVSSASQSLAQAPAAVTQAMTDLMTTQANVQSDLATLKSYFKGDPTALATVMSSLQGNSSTYSASGSVPATATLAADLKSGQMSGAQVVALLQSQTQDPLVAALDGTNSTTSGASSIVSMLG